MTLKAAGGHASLPPTDGSDVAGQMRRLLVALERNPPPLVLQAPITGGVRRGGLGGTPHGGREEREGSGAVGPNRVVATGSQLRSGPSSTPVPSHPLHGTALQFAWHGSLEAAPAAVRVRVPASPAAVPAPDSSWPLTHMPPSVVAAPTWRMARADMLVELAPLAPKLLRPLLANCEAHKSWWVRARHGA